MENATADRNAGLVLAPVSIGELFDKITILQLKSSRLTDPHKLRNVRCELDLLERTATGIAADRRIDSLVHRLSTVNGALWDVEDRLRVLEDEESFGDGFVVEARSVYKLNDERAALKRQINRLCGSAIVEEKSYGARTDGAAR